MQPPHALINTVLKSKNKTNLTTLLKRSTSLHILDLLQRQKDKCDK